MISTKPPKGKPCRVCQAVFMPQRMGAKVCSPFCALTFAKSVRTKAEKVALVKERRADKAKLQKLKGIPELLREAQNAFNAVIRERDRLAGHACISSGKPLDWSGNAVDAGHWRSRGAASHLRFNEDNVHCQTKHDNRYLAGNAGAYRIGLIARIGLERVEALESDNTPHKWTREELIAIKAQYAAKLKQMKQDRALQEISDFGQQQGWGT